MTRALVLLVGALGLAFVARAASIYRASDPLAHGLVLLIGLGLSLGIVELFGRAWRIARLERSLGALPRPMTIEGVDKATPELGAMLRARLIGAPASAPSASFTPYLIGLLVLIGLLGTFLGLFETLRGAREALTVSGDVDALRDGLVAPMTGLSRAFGTSAAGVSASAMLGLASAIVRRADARFLAMFGRYAAVELTPLTTQGRMLAALETLAQKGDALPDAARALEALSERLEKLEARMVEAEERSRAESAAVVRATAAEIRGDLKAGIEGAANAARAAVEPLLQETVTRAAGAAGDAFASISSRIEADSEARKQSERTQIDAIHALGRGLADAEAARNDALTHKLERSVTSISDAAARFAERETTRAQELDEQMQRLAASVEQAVSRSAHADAERLCAFREALAGMQRELHSSTTDAAARATAEIARVIEAVEHYEARFAESAAARADAHAQEIRELDATLEKHLEKLGEALVAPLGEVARTTKDAFASISSRIEADSEARKQSERTQIDAIHALGRGLADTEAARNDALTHKLERSVTSISDAAARFAERETTRAKELDEQMQRLAASVEQAVSRSAHADAERLCAFREALAGMQRELHASTTDAAARATAEIARVIEAVEHYEARFAESAAARADAHAQEIRELDATLEKHLEKLGEALAAPLGEVARATQAAPEAAARLVDAARQRLEAQERIESERDAKLAALIGGLEQTATAIHESSARGEAARLELAERAEGRAAANEERAARRFAELIEQLEHSMSQHAERLAAFEQRIEDTRRESAEALAERLATHARGLGESLDATISLVREASDLLRAGSAEMAAASEMFTRAVDRHRDASDRWLDSIGAIEDAIKRREGGESVDLLGAYLDQTREVFDHSIQFQRELFTELRALRNKANG